MQYTQLDLKRILSYFISQVQFEARSLQHKKLIWGDKMSYIYSYRRESIKLSLLPELWAFFSLINLFCSPQYLPLFNEGILQDWVYLYRDPKIIGQLSYKWGPLQMKRAPLICGFLWQLILTYNCNIFIDI
ncbi:Hypothetical_protein [Hexamita inflata]|uniref:Hypothetical_protein n=1 Tax=Hexamita inflata TaxID=28002 RepID=A0AA86U5Z5_9EUKA|nr:Hypothetical protein HINF_LOCUS31740 [Hexamita inflata]